MKIWNVTLGSPFVVAPMAGMTDTAFRRLVKRQGGCGLVVTEMVSSEGLVRGIDRTLEYAEYTEEERPVSIQIFGGDPDKMASAARIVEGMGANIVDVNMGCPVPKIAKHNAGCSLMREPRHAATVINAMAKAVTMRARGEFLLDYIELLVNERVNEADGFRHLAPGSEDNPNASSFSFPLSPSPIPPAPQAARGRERWVINKLRALCAWYSKGIDCGSRL